MSKKNIYLYDLINSFLLGLKSTIIKNDSIKIKVMFIVGFIIINWKYNKTKQTILQNIRFNLGSLDRNKVSYKL